MECSTVYKFDDFHWCGYCQHCHYLKCNPWVDWELWIHQTLQPFPASSSTKLQLWLPSAPRHLRKRFQRIQIGFFTLNATVKNIQSGQFSGCLISHRHSWCRRRRRWFVRIWDPWIMARWMGNHESSSLLTWILCRILQNLLMNRFTHQSTRNIANDSGQDGDKVEACRSFGWWLKAYWGLNCRQGDIRVG